MAFAHEAFVELTPASDQTQTLGETSVQSVTAEVINLVDNDLELDGTCAGDIFYITLLINSIISTMWTNSGFDVKLELDQSAFDDDGKGDFTDLSDTDLLSILEKYHVSYGLQFYQDDKTLVIKNSAAFTSCGITLTEDDYYYFLDNNINYSFDGSELRGKMIVEGANIKIPTDLSPEITSNLTKYYFRPELTSTALINGFIANVRSKHENLFYRVSGITLDLNRSDKSYLALKLGKTIALTLGAPDGSGGWSNTKIANHTVGNLGELYIKEIQFTSDGINDILSPILESELLGDEF